MSEKNCCSFNIKILTEKSIYTGILQNPAKKVDEPPKTYHKDFFLLKAKQHQNTEGANAIK